MGSPLHLFSKKGMMLSACLVTIFLCITIQTEGICLTDQTGPVKGEPCAFPFTFNERLYDKCTLWDWDAELGTNFIGRYWCSTETDEWGNHITGKYGMCTEARATTDDDFNYVA